MYESHRPDGEHKKPGTDIKAKYRQNKSMVLQVRSVVTHGRVVIIRRGQKSPSGALAVTFFLIYVFGTYINR